MTFVTIARSVSMLAVIGMLPVFAAGETVNDKSAALQREGIQLIRQVEEVSREVRFHTGRLNSLTLNMNVGREGHTQHLDRIKTLINDSLRPSMVRLEAIQRGLPEWKQAAISQMLECARTLAADTTSAILSKKETGPKPLAVNTEYRNFLASMYDHADKLVTTSDVAGDYASAHMKAVETGVKPAVN
jgi:hypothetical protein